MVYLYIKTCVEKPKESLNQCGSGLKLSSPVYSLKIVGVWVVNVFPSEDKNECGENIVILLLIQKLSVKLSVSEHEKCFYC